MEEENENKEAEEETKEPTASNLVDNATGAAERLEKAVEAQRVENDRQEELYAKQKLGGMSSAGQVAEKPKKMTDTEYSEALERGEVNPLKEDGFI